MSEGEAAHLASQLYQRLGHLERALDGHAFLVGDRFSIADVSVLPRVAMYPMIQLPIDAERYPNVSRWLAEVGGRPAFAQSVVVPPICESPA